MASSVTNEEYVILRVYNVDFRYLPSFKGRHAQVRRQNGEWTLGTDAEIAVLQFYLNYESKTKQGKETNILSEAEEVIYGDREQTYGAPDKNLQTIADLWHIYLGAPINVNDVCVMMILLKASRLKNSPEHHDSQVDICGYAALMERVQKYRKVNN